MKLSISNIAWDEKDDEEIYAFFKKTGFNGIEIAPSRIVGANPYSKSIEAKKICDEISQKYQFEISSMQSIWYGIKEELFNSKKEYDFLIEYTKLAIDFASGIGCNNLVFGCPKNRNINNKEDINLAKKFFEEIGGYADSKGTIIGIEANPKIYNTNFLNTTYEVVDFVESLQCKGIGINLDVGTIIENREDLDIIKKASKYINHVHISEPYLEKIVKRDIHKEIISILQEHEYNKYISIEMKNLNELEIVKEVSLYIKGLL